MISRLAHAVLAAELVDATTGIDDLLLARIERMTGGADLDHEVFAERRARREFIAATTGDLDVRIVGMDIGFHGCSLGRCLKKGRVGYSDGAILASA